MIGDRGAGKAALVAALVRNWPQSLTSPEEQFEGPKGSERGGSSGSSAVAAAAVAASSDVSFSTLAPTGSSSNQHYHLTSWFGATGSTNDSAGGSRLQGGEAWAGPLHVTRNFAPLSSKEAPFSCWVHRASLLGSAGSTASSGAATGATAGGGGGGASAAAATTAVSMSSGASARAVALHSRREPWIGGWRPLSMWADAVVIVVVDLTMDRRRLHTALKRHLKLLQAAAPENATVMVDVFLSLVSFPCSRSWLIL